jgi:hypothetical protein
LTFCQAAEAPETEARVFAIRRRTAGPMPGSNEPKSMLFVLGSCDGIGIATRERATPEQTATELL